MVLMQNGLILTNKKQLYLMNEEEIKEKLKEMTGYEPYGYSISIERAREFLGEHSKLMKDEEIKTILKMLYTMAQIAVDDYIFKKVSENEKKVYNRIETQLKQRNNLKVLDQHLYE